MLGFPNIILFGSLILNFLISNNIFVDVSLEFLSLTCFSRFITLFYLERSREDMSKYLVEESASDNSSRISIPLIFCGLICVQVCKGCC